MRLGLFALSTIGLLLAGAVCLPLADDRRPIPTGTVFGVSVSQPGGDRSVTLGTIVRVEWAITNQTDDDATVTLRSRCRSLNVPNVKLARNEVSLTMITDTLPASGAV